MHLDVQDVRLELHEQLVVGHAAVDAQLGDLHTGIGNHGIGDVASLVGSCLQNRTGDVITVSKAGETNDDAAGIRAPVRRKESGEGRHEVNTAVVFDGAGHVLDGGRVRNHLQVIAQPLHQGTAHGDRALERVDRAFTLALEAHRGQQTVLGELRGGTGVQQQE